MDQTRRKRLKVAAACTECRRKKTKCNGEQPCLGCQKNNANCEYIHHTTPSTYFYRSTVTSPQPPPVESPLTASTKKEQQQRRKSISSIEQRLVVIEDILRALLGDVDMAPDNMQQIVRHEGSENASHCLDNSYGLVQLPPLMLPIPRVPGSDRDRQQKRPRSSPSPTPEIYSRVRSPPSPSHHLPPRALQQQRARRSSIHHLLARPVSPSPTGILPSTFNPRPSPRSNTSRSPTVGKRVSSE
ncbi:hypothetical protein BCR43DRAFT_488849 [Syncephalastrum racemosum]|uniref:Zn(2)-C6 fungal-type domain-containing protein n=1 Tax=Syncephalastrum racemosum TaxID=13706 RepID=A0A1X2HJI6_SYNRA|nr:hypothetical protein BCR43DRAFT_488849 [Syncephalastrum racemosum]